MRNYVLSVTVDNHAGVLTRVCQLFNRRGYNLESVTAGITEDENISRLTLIGKVEKEGEIEQITKQINKLENVHEVVLLENNKCICKEIMFIRVQADQYVRNNIMSIVEIFKGNVVDVSQNSVVIQVTGDEKKLKAFMDLMEPFGILEVVKSGYIAISRGESDFASNKLEDKSNKFQVASGQ